MWIDYPEDKNCTLIAVDKHGPMTLKEVAERHQISIVRAKQIIDSTLKKIKNVISTPTY
jgi:DNA-directed RNA polymerase sigma subunit (sigma70/sigma32)